MGGSATTHDLLVTVLYSLSRRITSEVLSAARKGDDEAVIHTALGVTALKRLAYKLDLQKLPKSTARIVIDLRAATAEFEMLYISEKFRRKLRMQGEALVQTFCRIIDLGRRLYEILEPGMGQFFDEFYVGAC